jgi:hypothetical protein
MSSPCLHSHTSIVDLGARAASRSVVAKVAAAHCQTATPRNADGRGSSSIARLAPAAAGTVTAAATAAGLQYDGSMFDCWVRMSLPPAGSLTPAAAVSAAPGTSPLDAAIERLAAATAPVAAHAGAQR